MQGTDALQEVARLPCKGPRPFDTYLSQAGSLLQTYQPTLAGGADGCRDLWRKAGLCMF